jgi:hypothetical protein
MSLLFLGSVGDGFQALDDAGLPLPFAELTFWKTATTTPQAVYADQELTQVLSDAAGRVIGDASGSFPWIYLSETGIYRVRLRTAQGVLRWDIDPYICDCTDPPYVFRNPFHQALTLSSGYRASFVAPSLGGASMLFTDHTTGSSARVFADAEKKVPHPTPLKSNGAGIFPAIYLDDAITYRVRVNTAQGVQIADVDPYSCECGFLMLTSKPYALIPIDDLTASHQPTNGNYGIAWSDGFAPTTEFTSGVLLTPIITYSNWPLLTPEQVTASWDWLAGGTLVTPIITYSNWPLLTPEQVTASWDWLAGSNMIAPLVFYDNWPFLTPEQVTASMDFLSGSTLT